MGSRQDAIEAGTESYAALRSHPDAKWSMTVAQTVLDAMLVSGAVHLADKCHAEPNLGCATTRELLAEIKARGDVSHTIGEYPEEMGGMAIGAANLLDTLPGSMLDYKTVGSGHES